MNVFGLFDPVLPHEIFNGGWCHVFLPNLARSPSILNVWSRMSGREGNFMPLLHKVMYLNLIIQPWVDDKLNEFMFCSMISHFIITIWVSHQRSIERTPLRKKGNTLLVQCKFSRSFNSVYLEIFQWVLQPCKLQSMSVCKNSCWQSASNQPQKWWDEFDPTPKLVLDKPYLVSWYAEARIMAQGGLQDHYVIFL